MAENTVKVDISFHSLLEAISSLGITEKHQLWEFLEAIGIGRILTNPPSHTTLQAGPHRAVQHHGANSNLNCQS
jgi:hypothetical protein